MIDQEILSAIRMFPTIRHTNWAIAREIDRPEASVRRATREMYEANLIERTLGSDNQMRYSVKETVV